MIGHRLVNAVRQPEYIGENRCPPCTAVNVVIAVLLSGAIAILSIQLAVTVFLVGLALIYLRGYLVPGTPTLTKRYLPDRVLAAFDKAEGPQPTAAVAHTLAPSDANGTRSEEPTKADVDPPAVDDVEAFLRRAGAVTDCPDSGVDEACLAEEFRAAWLSRADELADSADVEAAFAERLGVDPERVVVISHGASLVVNLDGALLGKWASREAFVADMAADIELDKRVPGWTALSVERRSEVLHGLRALLDECPGCGGFVELSQEVVESCCRSTDVLAATCRECGARMLEVEAPAAE